MWQNIATKYRQATQECCKRKTEDLKAYPRQFYKTFKLFLSDKKQKVASTLELMAISKRTRKR